MSETIEFEKIYHYNLYSVGIAIPIRILANDAEALLDAKVDTGSTFCVFQRLHGELIGLDIESGSEANIGTPTGWFTAFGHEVTVRFLDIEMLTIVYFAESDRFDRNVLGRAGWLNRVKLGLIEPEGKLLISAY